MRSMSHRMALMLALMLAVRFGAGCAATDSALYGGAPGAADDDDLSGDDDAWDDDDDDASGNCQIVGTAPVDGDPTVYYRDSIEVHFAEPVDWADVVLDDPQRSVAGITTLADDGLKVRFDPFGEEPDEHLEPLTDYRASVTGPGCTASWSFTTSVLGTPLNDELQDGDAYIVELGHGALVEPTGIGSLMDLIELQPFLVAVTDVVGDELDLVAARMDSFSLTQDCGLTVDVTHTAAAELSGSHLTVPSIPLEIPLKQEIWDGDEQYWLSVLELGVEAEFSPDGSTLSHGRLTGVIDGFEVDGLLALMTGNAQNYQAGSTCDLLEQLGTPCEACPGNPELPSCISFVIDGVDAYAHNTSVSEDADGCSD